jgi:hypothetical protein
MGRPRRQQYYVNPVSPAQARPKARLNERGQWFNPMQPNARGGPFQTGDYVLYQSSPTPQAKLVKGFIQAIFSDGTAAIVGVGGEKDLKGRWSLKKLELLRRRPRLRYEFLALPKDPKPVGLCQSCGGE